MCFRFPQGFSEKPRSNEPCRIWTRASKRYRKLSQEPPLAPPTPPSAAGAPDLWTRAEQFLKEDKYNAKLLQRAISIIEAHGLSFREVNAHPELREFLGGQINKLEERVHKHSQVTRILEALMPLKDLVNNVASSSASASIACAAVTIGFQLAIQAVSQGNILLQGLERIPGVICRVHKYTEIFMSPNEEIKDDFTVKLYQDLQNLASKILEFEARTLCYLDRPSAIKSLRDVFKIDPWETLIQEINDAEAEVKKFGELLNSGNVVAIKTSTEAQITSKQKTQDEKTRNSFIKALSTCNYRERKDRNRERVPGTCEWFTNHRIFRSWIESEKPLPLWVSADPGCGKSVLSKHLIDNAILSSSERTVCYFFFKDDFSDQKTSSSALASLLRQVFLAQPDIIPDSALKKFKSDKESSFISFKDLWNILMEVCANPKATEIVFIMDALDECQDDDRTELMRAVIELYSSQHAYHNLKILITSRPYEHIRSAFRELEGQVSGSAQDKRWDELEADPLDASMLHLSGESEREVIEISAEIDLVIEDRIHQIAKAKQLTKRELELFQDHFKKNSQRTYLWVALVMDLIENTTWVNGGKARQTLRELPSTVNEAYEKILGRSSDPDTARRILHLVMAAAEPLDLNELALALAVNKPDQSDEDIEDAMEPPERSRHTFKDVCGCLLTIIDDKVYLLHQTVKEFLVRPPSLSVQTSTSEIWHHSLPATESHRSLAKVCLLVLLAEGSSRHDCLDFYSGKFWGYHLFQFSYQKSDEITNLARDFCAKRSRQKISKFSQISIYQKMKRFYPELSEVPLAIACFYRLTEVALLMLDSENELEVQSLTGQALVRLATDCGLEAVLRRLISRGAEVNSFDIFGKAPLHRAVADQSEPIVDLLLKSGAEVNILEKGDPIRGFSPLVQAIETGNVSIINRLLEAGAEVTPQVITAATQAGDDSITKRLVALVPNFELGPTINLLQNPAM